MKSDRLIATLLLLQARGRVTASELAGSNETSVATARRDLEALSAAGVPVYPQPGRGGGWQLVGGARTDLSGLTAGEAQALFLLLGPAVTSRPEARSALAKLLQALPATFRQDAATAAGAVVVDPARWGFEGAGADQASDDLLRQLQHAAVAGDVVQLEYRRRDGAESVRDVQPLGLVEKDGRWYLVADGERGRRTYRLDRIIAAVTTDRTFVRPDVDLQSEWAAIAGRVEHQRAAVHATVRTTRPVAMVLHTQFGAAYEELEMEGETRTLRLGAHLLAALVEQLAGWGDRIEVLEPPEVRAGLARTGAALVALYRTESHCCQRL
ncbi:MAG: YafY family transcriptional regulator [Humibacillus sp.]|nr:YafY family transcriptional regulator [Humibacillus sp.]MDN5780187.1 YafY family transcriptional regulator [Humibacillus sp.]